MSEMRSTLVINQVWRRTTDGNVEALDLSAGVNLIVGGPNTGKTKWLETIDYLLGDSGDTQSDTLVVISQGIAQPGARRSVLSS